jgi:hypothetical protein
MASALVVPDLGVERVRRRRTSWKCNCSENAERKEREKERTSHVASCQLRLTAADTTPTPMGRQERGSVLFSFEFFDFRLLLEPILSADDDIPF